MTDLDAAERHFLAAILHDPDDAGLRLVYADWLEERDRYNLLCGE